MYKFTIIIPHYNIPELLNRALESIPKNDDIQIIVVDDCSPNSSCYRQSVPGLQRKNVEFYKTPYGGSAGRARNIGLEHALGKWLIFVDADDLLSADAMRILNDHYEDKEDIIYFMSKVVMSDNLNVESDRFDPNMMISYTLKTDDDSALRFHTPQPWGKMVRSDFVKENYVRFSETRYCNDAYFATHIGILAKRVKATDEIFYILTERDGSLASSQFNRKRVSKKEIIDRYIEPYKCFKLMKTHNISEYSSIFEYVDKRGSKEFYKDQRAFWIIFKALWVEAPKDAMILLLVALLRPFNKLYRIVTGRQKEYAKNKFEF